MLALLVLIACGPAADPAPTPAAEPVPAEPAPAEPTAPEPTPAAHDWPTDCADPTSPEVRYQHPTWAEREICERIRFRCDEGWEPFGDACGCGCKKSASGG